MKKIFRSVLFVTVLLLIKQTCFSQKECGTPGIQSDLTNANKNYKKNRDKLFDFHQQFDPEFSENHNRSIITVPVVVHIVYKNDLEKISLDVINEQISILNRDFRAQNTDLNLVPDRFKHLIADSNIEFRLAIRSPDNKPTNGVTYTKTITPIFTMGQDNVKFTNKGGKDAWDTRYYLNIWVCHLDQFVGYGTPPGLHGRVSNRDGVVIKTSAFGKRVQNELGCELGRTLTHEVGHWLDLAHIWGPCLNQTPCCSSCLDDDGINDTPQQNRCNQGNISLSDLRTSCNNAIGDLFMNFMDYVDDNILIMFTQGQCVRMWGTLTFARKDISNSKGLLPVSSSRFLNSIF